ncbi:MAG: DNA primase regulatory subunit PriL [Thermoplasmata archaeon]
MPADATPLPLPEGTAGLRVLAMYPFLTEASRYIRQHGLPIEEVLDHRAFEGARSRARRKVFTSLDTGDLPNPPLSRSAECLEALYAYPLARILVSCVGDSFLVRRYALAEADLARRRLSREDDEFLLTLSRALGLDTLQEGAYRLHFSDFLRATRQLRGKEWKLINQPVQDGFVLLSRDRFLRVVEGHLRNRFEAELPLEVNPTLLRAFEEEVMELRTALRDRRSKLQGEDLGAIRVTNFPPCMQKLLAAVLASENVSHPGRFALVAFMNNIGLGFDEIYQIFASVPDFRESVTRYQIEHITGQISSTVYTAPECSTMKSYGICPGPDNLCETITHPLSYYRKKTRMAGTAKARKAPSDQPVRGAS